jgi:hypothetical protein
VAAVEAVPNMMGLEGGVTQAILSEGKVQG